MNLIYLALQKKSKEMTLICIANAVYIHKVTRISNIDLNKNTQKISLLRQSKAKLYFMYNKFHAPYTNQIVTYT